MGGGVWAGAAREGDALTGSSPPAQPQLADAVLLPVDFPVGCGQVIGIAAAVPASRPRGSSACTSESRPGVRRRP